jgi:Cd2+/Zn2+-exporting ATPase
MSKNSGCCSDDDDHKESHEQEHGDHDHGHSHGDSEFDLKSEIMPVAIVVGLFLMGSIYNEPLHKTPYAIAEYLVLIPAYLLSGWNVLMVAGKRGLSSIGTKNRVKDFELLKSLFRRGFTQRTKFSTLN